LKREEQKMQSGKKSGEWHRSQVTDEMFGDTQDRKGGKIGGTPFFDTGWVGREELICTVKKGKLKKKVGRVILLEKRRGEVGGKRMFEDPSVISHMELRRLVWVRSDQRKKVAGGAGMVES